jgi:hypothetical protein
VFCVALSIIALLVSSQSEASPETKLTAKELAGKLVVRYQGWFNTPTDGLGKGWALDQRSRTGSQYNYD